MINLKWNPGYLFTQPRTKPIYNYCIVFFRVSKSSLASYRKKRALLSSLHQSTKRGLRFSNHGNPLYLFLSTSNRHKDRNILTFLCFLSLFQIISEKNRREISKYLFQGLVFFCYGSIFSNLERKPVKDLLYFFVIFGIFTSSCGFWRIGINVSSQLVILQSWFNNIEFFK